MVGKGQPPKKPEDRRKDTTILISQKERKEIDEAREKTGEKFVPFVRTAALEKARKINNRE